MFDYISMVCPALMSILRIAPRVLTVHFTVRFVIR